MFYSNQIPIRRVSEMGVQVLTALMKVGVVASWLVAIPSTSLAQDHPAPPSTIVVIEDQAEVFFDLTDEAHAKLKEIGQRDEAWKRVQRANAHAERNPGDEAAQIEKRNARASLLHGRVEMMRMAISLEEPLLHSHQEFTARMNAEVAAARQQLQSSATETNENQVLLESMYSQLRRISQEVTSINLVDELAEDDLEMLELAEQELSKIQQDLLLAEDAQELSQQELKTLLSLQARALQDMTKLKRAFSHMRGDVDTFTKLARNDLKYIQVRKRQKRADQLAKRPPIEFGSRPLMKDLLGRRRQFQPLDNPADGLAAKRKRVADFLRNLPRNRRQQPSKDQLATTPQPLSKGGGR